MKTKREKKKKEERKRAIRSAAELVFTTFSIVTICLE